MIHKMTDATFRHAISLQLRGSAPQRSSRPGGQAAAAVNTVMGSFIIMVGRAATDITCPRTRNVPAGLSCGDKTAQIVVWIDEETCSALNLQCLKRKDHHKTSKNDVHRTSAVNVPHTSRFDQSLCFRAPITTELWTDFSWT